VTAMPWPSTDSGMKSEDDGVDGGECDSRKKWLKLSFTTIVSSRWDPN
jgi:hypothetical protein